MHHLVKFNEKPGGMLRVQIQQAECSCGWQSPWSMSVIRPQEEFDFHLKDVEFEKSGWVMECQSPLEIRHEDGSFVTGKAARDIINEVMGGTGWP